MAAFRPVAASRYQSFPALVSTLQCLFLYRYHGPRSLRLASEPSPARALIGLRAIDNRRIYSPQSVPATMSLVAKLACRNFRHSLAILGVCGSLSLLGSLPASAPALAGDEPATAAPAAPPAAEAPAAETKPAGSRSKCLSRRRRRIRCRSVTSGSSEIIRGPPRASMSSLKTPALPAQNWPTTKIMPAASSPAMSTASMSQPSARPTKRWRRRKSSSIAVTISCWSTPRPRRCSSFRTGPRARTFSSSTSAPPMFRSARKIAAPMSCMWCRTATCWPTRSPNIS